MCYQKNKWWIGCLWLLLLGIARAEPIDGIVATVNDTIITQTQLDQSVHTERQRLQQNQQPIPDAATLRKTALNNLIDISLQLQVAKQMNMNVDDATLDRTLETMAHEHNITFAELPEALSKQGIVYEQFRKDIRNQILLSQLHARATNVSVSDADVRHAMSMLKAAPDSEDRVRVQDVLIALPTTATAEQLASIENRLRTLLEQLKVSRDPNGLLQETSKRDPSVRVEDLGWRQWGQLPSLFMTLLSKAQVGEWVGPIRAPNGMHIIRMVDRQGGAHVLVQTHLRQIVLRPHALTSSADLRLRLTELRDKLVHGEDFATIADTNSQDTETAHKGGDMGWITQGEIDPMIEHEMTSLDINQISQPFMAGGGSWYLIQVLGRREIKDPQAFIHNRAKQMAYQQKQTEAVKIWISGLRRSAYIKIEPLS